MGVTWDAQEDGFRFNKATTKSSISKASSVWDPRGLLLPFLIRSKIILQNLNRLQYGWDDELKEVDLCEWREWFKESELLETVQIPRALFGRNEPLRETTLHVFCDASQDNDGACEHLKREYEYNVV